MAKAIKGDVLRVLDNVRQADELLMQMNAFDLVDAEEAEEYLWKAQISLTKLLEVASTN